MDRRMLQRISLFLGLVLCVPYVGAVVEAKQEGRIERCKKFVREVFKNKRIQVGTVGAGALLAVTGVIIVWPQVKLCRETNGILKVPAGLKIFIESDGKKAEVPGSRLELDPTSRRVCDAFCLTTGEDITLPVGTEIYWYDKKGIYKYEAIYPGKSRIKCTYGESKFVSDRWLVFRLYDVGLKRFLRYLS